LCLGCAAYSTQAVTLEALETGERSEASWWKPNMTGCHWGTASMTGCHQMSL